MSSDTGTPRLVGLDGLSLKCPLVFMEFPFFQVTKEKILTHENWSYISKRNNRVRKLMIELQPTVSGLPTIYDLNVVIFLCSQIVLLNDRGLEVADWVRFNPNKLFEFTRRTSGGTKYKGLQASLSRLAGTLITTNVVSDQYLHKNEFHLIDAWKCVSCLETGRMLHIEIKLSAWLLSQFDGKKIKTLSSNYFSITKPFTRRLYLIFAKHAGQTAEWKISIEKLHSKHGYRGSKKSFKHKLANFDTASIGFVVRSLPNEIISISRL